MSNVGFRIFKKAARPDQRLIDDLGRLPVAVIGDELSRRGCLHARIKQLNGKSMIGVALTVKARTGDNLLFHRALDMAGPGDVIVVDGQGELCNALAGENMMLWAQERGVSGVVVDGAMRDIEAISQMHMPIFAAGIQPNGPYKSGPGEINVPISCGGVVIQPGDLVLGDPDGIVAVRGSEAAEVLKRSLARLEKEKRTRVSILDGTYDRSPYTEDALRQLGCEIFDQAWDDRTA